MPKKYDNETRREMQYKRQKAWYEKNKEHMREYRKARYEKLKADRVCVVCRKPMGDDPHCYCESCREYQKKVYHNRNAMAADAVEVVRCKDCEKWRNMTNDPQYKVCWCGEWHTTTRYDDFCSYGERRASDGD